MSQAPRLEAALTRRLLWGTALMLMMLNASLALVAHRQIHAQTDAMLLELAALEARVNLIQPTHLRVQSGALGVPSWGGALTPKYALIHDERCRVLAATPQLQAMTQVPAAWCQHAAPAAFFTDVEGDYDLRVGTHRAHVPGRGELTFMVGVAHQSLDRSVWVVVLTGALASALMLLVLWALIVASARGVTQQLERLGHACDALELGQAASPERLRGVDLSAPRGRPTREVQALSRTLTQLVARLVSALEAQGRFVAVAAHELRTPITALRGELEVTLRRPRTPQEYQEALGYMLSDLERLETLTEALLAAARADSPRGLSARTARAGASCSAHAALERALALHASALRASDLEVLVEGPWTQARLGLPQEDATRVLSNLIGNAASHSGARRLRLSLSLASRDGDHDHDSPTAWRAIIEDDGCGVSPQLRDGLGSPFHRGESSAGHGLGLYITRRVLEASGGSLAFEPRERGVRWRIDWPAQAHPEPAHPDA